MRSSRPPSRLLRVLILQLALTVTATAVAGAELLMFEDPGCPWCRRWNAEIAPGYAQSPEGHRAPLRRVPIREPAKAGVGLARPVTATPTFVLIEAGREVGRLVGYSGSEFFYPLLDELLARLPAEQGRPDRRAEAVRPHKIAPWPTLIAEPRT
jgi:hypothetical protein